MRNKTESNGEPRWERLPEATRKRVEEMLAEAMAQSRGPRVLFVCLGNICRSPAAQGVAAAYAEAYGLKDAVFDSGGFYGGHAGDLPDSRMRSAAFQRGYRLDHRSRTVRRQDYAYFDLIIGMDDRNMDDLYRTAATPEEERKLFRMTDFCVDHSGERYVPDPYYEGAAGFQLVLDLLEDGCDTLVSLLKHWEEVNLPGLGK